MDDSRNLIIFGNWSHGTIKNHLTRAQTLLSFKELNVSDHQLKNSKLELWKIDNATRFKVNPAKYFIIAGINSTSLRLVLYVLKKSMWWNVYGFFIFENIYPSSCDEVHDYLKTIWSYNILSAIFVCMDSDSKILIYTFNPYNHEAPEMWTRKESLLQTNGHPFVIFRCYEAKLKSKLYPTPINFTILDCLLINRF